MKELLYCSEMCGHPSGGGQGDRGVGAQEKRGEEVGEEGL